MFLTRTERVVPAAAPANYLLFKRPSSTIAVQKPWGLALAVDFLMIVIFIVVS